MNKPNVLLLTIDALRADRLGCYGYQRRLTPNLDRLPAQGVRFAQAITGGSWTQAAFPVMLTATYASMHGGCLGALAPERPAPIEALARHGYSTGGFSTSPLLSPAYGYDRGFDHFADLAPDESDPALSRMKGGQRLLRSRLTHTVLGRLGKQTRPAKTYVTGAELTNAVCSWLDKVRTPFFAWAHYMDVHWPYQQEEKLRDPAAIAQAWRDRAHLHNANWNGAVITHGQRDHYIQLYEQALAYTDAQIGHLLEHLAGTGLAGNTIIVATADHGEEFLEHGRWGHWENNLHDEILRVPFVMRLPEQRDSRVVSRQVSTLDLMPTLLDLCGCPAPEGMLGSSLAPLWQGGQASNKTPVAISEMWREGWHIIAVRTEAFKYLWDSRRPNAPSLYELRRDPAEKHNVSARFPELARQLHAHIEERLKRAAETRPVLMAASPEADAKLMERLRGLGYVE